MGYAASMVEMKKTNAYKILVGELQRKILIWRLGCRWEDNIKKEVEEIRREGGHWIHLAQYRVQWCTFMKTIIKF